MAELSVAELRALVLERQRRVTAKIARTRRNNGTDLSGTQHDPRRSRSALGKYNRRQLQAVLKQYNSFTARTTQFYGDAEGRPVAARQWRAYQKAERTFNAASQQRFSKFANTDVPGKNMTAAQYRAATTPEFPVAGNPARNDQYPQFQRKPSNMASAGAIGRLIKDMQRKASPEHWQKVVRANRRTALKIVEGVGDDEMRREIKKLNNEQFEWLWNISPFAGQAALVYGLRETAGNGRQKNWMDEVGDAQLGDMWDTVRAAKRIK
jgi:hypothetical protein